MGRRIAAAAAVLVALVTALAWAAGLSSKRALVRPRVTPSPDAVGQVSMRFTSSGRRLDFRLSGLAKRTLYAVRVTQDDHPVLSVARTDKKGRAKFVFNKARLPIGILEPLANRPVEVVEFKKWIPGAVVLIGRLPLVSGFPYWGQPPDAGNGTRLPGVGDPGPFAVEAATYSLPSHSSGLDTGATVIWYPGAGGVVASGGPFPPVVFVHATKFRAEQYANWGRTIASWGFVVTLLDHDDPTPSLDPAKPDGQSVVRATLDAMQWLLDQNLDAGSRFHGKLDVQRFAFIGHEMGGGAAIVAAARGSTLGRVKAAVGLGPLPLFVQSGLFGTYVPYTPDADSGVWPPTLVLTGTRDASVDPLLSREFYFDAAPKPRGYVQIGTHCGVNYADALPLDVPSDYVLASCDAPDTQRKTARGYVIPWLLSHLKGDVRVTDYVDGTWATEQENVVEVSFD
jgi:hypothetical protein